MHLREVQIEGFRSIRAKETVTIDPAVTVLIGANDHGKTNILLALASLNDDRPFTEADRHWDRAEPGLPVVEWRFRLDEADRAAIAGFPAEGKPRGAVAEVTDEVVFSRRGPGGSVEVVGPAGLPAP